MRINKKIKKKITPSLIVPIIKQYNILPKLPKRKNCCTIVIPHVNTPYYLYGCIDQIKRYRHPEINQKIIVIDQSKYNINIEVCRKYISDFDVTVITAPQVDAGFPLDLGLNHADTEYYCSLDCDAFPIHKNWLYLPIKLIEKYNFSFVGTDTGLSSSYKQKGDFSHINNYFRVSKTHIAQTVSDTVGFMRPSNRKRVGFVPKDERWGDLSCDNGVIAQWYSDQEKMGDKFAFSLNKKLGLTKEMGLYGIVVDDLVFHIVFGWGEEWIDDLQKVLGENYLKLIEEIKSKPIDNNVIQNLINRCVHHDHPRTINSQAVPDDINDFVEEIKNR